MRAWRAEPAPSSMCFLLGVYYLSEKISKHGSTVTSGIPRTSARLSAVPGNPPLHARLRSPIPSPRRFNPMPSFLRAPGSSALLSRVLAQRNLLYVASVSEHNCVIKRFAQGLYLSVSCLRVPDTSAYACFIIVSPKGIRTRLATADVPFCYFMQ